MGWVALAPRLFASYINDFAREKDSDFKAGTLLYADDAVVFAIPDNDLCDGW